MTLWEFLNNLSTNMRFYSFILALVIFLGGGWLAHIHPDWFAQIFTGWASIIAAVGAWLALGARNGNGNGSYSNGAAR